MTGRRTDDGAVAVWVLALACVLVAVLGVAAIVADLLAARQRAAAAADLAALAGAARSAYGEAVACRAADEVARADGAQVTRCRLVDGTLDGTVDGTSTGTGDVRVVVTAWPRSAAGARVAAALLPDGVRVEARAGLR
jgi:secretion/DNA translocation related TadE-like protein